MNPILIGISLGAYIILQLSLLLIVNAVIKAAELRQEEQSKMPKDERYCRKCNALVPATELFQHLEIHSEEQS